MLHLLRILIIVVGFCAASINHVDAAVRASALYNANLPNPSAFVTWGSEVNGLEAAVYGPRAVDLEGSSYYVALRNVTTSRIDICPLLLPKIIALDQYQQDIKQTLAPSFSSFQPGTDTVEIDPGETYVYDVRARLGDGYGSVPVGIASIRADIRLTIAGPNLESCINGLVTRLRSAIFPISLG
jgi:hypothetical protein